MEIPRPEHPRPDFKREDWLNLNGKWMFKMGGQEDELKRGLDELSSSIIVPFPPESKLSGIQEKGFMNLVWYGRKFKIPRDWFSKRILLHFGAVDYEARVWVNDREVGYHRGGYTPFAFDITDSVTAEEFNEVKVLAIDDNRTGLQASGKQSPRLESFGCYYTRVTGIWQTVWLEAVPSTYIRHFRFLPTSDFNSICIEVDVGGKRKISDLKLTISLDDREVSSAQKSHPSFPAIFNVKLSNAKRWSPEEPTLYDLTLEASNKDEVDVVKSYFGIRKISIRDNAILLNERKKFLRLVLDQGYYPDGIYTAPSDDALKKDIELAMEMGFDGARLHQKVFEPRFLYWADKLGYLVTGEYPDWGADLTNPLAREAMLDEWIEVIKRDINHPSIIIWTPLNERVYKRSDKLVVDFVRRIVKVTRSMDPTRPIIDSSGYVHVDTDIYDIHDYEQDVSVFKSHYDKFGETGSSKDLWINFREESIEYSGQPVMISEYGGTWWNPEKPNDSKAWGYGSRPSTIDEFLNRYKLLTETLLSNPNISAFCYTQLYDIEQEVNGLLSYERKPKFDIQIIRKINTKEAAIESKIKC